MDIPPVPVKKKGLGPLAWTGIGCGGLLLLVIIGGLVVSMMYGSKFKEFAEDMQKDPTRATATTMVKMSGGRFEMVAEDVPGKRYTVREKAKGTDITIYWNEKKHATETIPGDFSAIPKDSATAPAPAPEPVPAPAR